MPADSSSTAVDPRRLRVADALARRRGYATGAVVREHFQDADVALAAADAVDPARLLLARVEAFARRYLTSNPDTFTSSQIVDELRLIESAAGAILVDWSAGHEESTC